MKLFIGIIVFSAILFKIFTELYAGNFCAPLGAHVIENTREEIDKMAKCQDHFMCKVGSINKFNQEQGSGEVLQMKHFTCDRRF